MNIVALAQELKNDPAEVGYKYTDGTLKTERELLPLLLNKPLIDNPTKQGTVLKLFNENDVLSLISTESIGKIDYNAIMSIREAIESQDRKRLALQLQICAAKQWITTDEYAALQNLFNETIPDPNWKPKIYGKCRLEIVTGELTIGKQELEQARLMAQV